MLTLLACTEAQTIETPPASVNGRGYATLREAIDAAEDGDVIELADGTFDGGLEILKPLTIKGAGSERTILDGADGSVVVVHGQAELVRIEGLTITGGRSGSTWLHPTQDSSWEGGGGVATAATVTLADVVVRDNRAQEGGGIFIVSDGYYTGRLITESGVRIERNTAEYGSAIFAAFGDFWLSGVEIRDNHGTDDPTYAVHASDGVFGQSTFVGDNDEHACGAFTAYEANVEVIGATVLGGACISSHGSVTGSLRSEEGDWGGSTVTVEEVGVWTYGEDATFECDTESGCR